MEKPLLILDLDETLLHGSYEALNLPYDFKVEDIFVYKRPYLDQFLEEISKIYQLAIWSSAGKDYVAKIAENIISDTIKLAFCWSVERCTYRRNIHLDTFYYIKDLQKVKRKKYKLDRVLIVDNTKSKMERNYGNAVHIEDFTGDPKDQMLPHLLDYLTKIKDTPNFRIIEKRGWQNKYH